MNNDESGRGMHLAKMTAGLTLALTLFAQSAGAQTQPAKPLPADAKPDAQTYQTLYLTNLIQERDVNELFIDLRNMFPKAKLFALPSQSAISIFGTPDDILLARKILSDLDRVQKIYRLTYTITETDGGKRVGVQHFALIVVSGGKTILKQGSKVPVITGTLNAGGTTQNSQVQYLDVGLNIEASLNVYLDGVRLLTKVEQSSLAEEKSTVSIQDPVIRQTLLEGTSTLVQGKPLVLGSLDVPGSTRHQEIEVVSELVR